MTLTTYPATTDSSDLAALNISRLLARLEQNLLSPNADLKTLRRSEYQQMRVSAVCPSSMIPDLRTYIHDGKCINIYER
jgi:hypothetical protein